MEKLHFPLYEDEAGNIINKFRQSPFGRGSKTVVDKSVRNSLELDPARFEILNPKWDLYVKDILVPRIGQYMSIEHSFHSSLYKLLLYQKGSFFKRHRDSEKEDGMFATLIIQLPSKFQGGELVVSHDGNVKKFDFSSKDADEFSTFYSVFYCDCEHEILPVTEGLRLCLIYNLIAGNKNSITAPPKSNTLELELKAVFDNWNVPGKIIYALKHQYTQKSLSFDNLKTSDETIANILKSLSESSSPLNIYLATFEKVSRGPAIEGDFDEESGFYNENEIDFDSNDDDYDPTKDYELKKLIPICGSEALSLTLQLDFDDEVIPEGCFDKIVPYKRTQEPTGNEGVNVEKFYRTAAIVFWPKRHTLKVLKDSGASDSVLRKYFLKEGENIPKKLKDEENRKDLLAMTEVIHQPESEGSSKSHVKTKRLADSSHDEFHATGAAKRIRVEEEKADDANVNMLKALIDSGDVDLLLGSFDQVNPTEEVIPLIAEQCQKLGWKTFSTPLVSMFKKTESVKNSISFLTTLIGNEKLDISQQEVIWTILEVVSEKLNVGKLDDLSHLYSVCTLAEKVDYNMFHFMTKLPVNMVVPVLIKLAKTSDKEKQDLLGRLWVPIAKHFITELEKKIGSKSTIKYNWQRDITLNMLHRVQYGKPACSCKDCSTLIEFLNSDVQSKEFNVGKARRRHLHGKMKNIDDFNHETESEEKNGILVATKTRKTGKEEMDSVDALALSLEQIRKLILE